MAFMLIYIMSYVLHDELWSDTFQDATLHEIERSKQHLYCSFLELKVCMQSIQWGHLPWYFFCMQQIMVLLWYTSQTNKKTPFFVVACIVCVVNFTNTGWTDVILNAPALCIRTMKCMDSWCVNESVCLQKMEWDGCVYPAVISNVWADSGLAKRSE